MTLIKALIIGAGKIGAFYDTPNQKEILTHAHAYSTNPEIEFLGFIDNNIRIAENAARIWGGIYSDKISETIFKLKPQIVSICTPVTNRLEILTEIIKIPEIKVLYLEKPLANNIDELSKYKKLFLKANIACQVNYLRRFDKTILSIKERIDKSEFGSLQRAIILYGKGFKNNASHLLNLLIYLWSDLKDEQIINKHNDYTDDDLSLEVFAQFSKGGVVNILPLDERFYSNVELILFFENSKIHFKQSGFQYCISEIRKDPIFAGYTDLNESRKFNKTELWNAFPTATQNIVSYIRNGSKLLCPVEDAIQTEMVLHRIYSKIDPKDGEK